MIFMDMDGVLADHVAGACDWTGRPIEELVTPGVWEIPLVDWAQLPMAFWVHLPKTPDFARYEGILRSCDGYILTHPCSSDCYDGKLIWLEQHLPWFQQDRMIMTEHKHLLSAEGRVLYDDRNENVDDWTKAGGHGQLVDRMWNRGHQRCARRTS